MWVGATTTVVDYAVMNVLLLKPFEAPTWVAVSAGYLVGILVNYLLCVAWIFKSDPSRRYYEFLGSMAVGIVGLLLNNVIVITGEKLLPGIGPLVSLIENTGLDEVVPNIFVNIAKLVATFVVLAWNFLARKYLIFRLRKPEDN
ncbi:MAG: GtrA family protein [Planctomycetota bacterium]|nr:GtrA family protein [Planctomycetota bacterium]